MDRRGFLTAASIATTIGLAGCSQAPGENGGDGEDTETTEEETQTAPAATGTTRADGGDGGTTEVAMITRDGEYIFDPIGLFVESGTTVSFVIESGAHSSTAYAEGNGGAEVTRIPDGAEPWDSETISGEGTSFEHTFETAGTYDYFCIPHKTLGMIGRIVVDEPGGPAEGSMPPDGDVPESQDIVDQGSISYDDFSG